VKRGNSLRVVAFNYHIILYRANGVSVNLARPPSPDITRGSFFDPTEQMLTFSTH
jgi:hypothetical protein